MRRIKQISGGSNFNEVFFTDVRVPDRQRLGNVGDGWKVSITTLMTERLAVGDAPGPDFADIFALARTLELDEGSAIRNPAVREKLADWYVKAQGLKYTKFRTMTALSRGHTPGPAVVSATDPSGGTDEAQRQQRTSLRHRHRGRNLRLQPRPAGAGRQRHAGAEACPAGEAVPQNEGL